MIDFQKHWGIEAISIEELRPDNPFSASRAWNIDGKYLLKAQGPLPDIKLAKELVSKGIPAPLPIGNFSLKHEGLHYQLFPLHHRAPLDYADVASAEKVAKALSLISRASVDAGESSIMKNIDPGVSHPCISHLEKNLMPFIHLFEKRISHGDMHPGNIVWDGRSPVIIDWELVSKREELHDLAFLLGCIGMDNPALLQGDFVNALLKSYYELAKPTKIAFSLLPEMVLATRVSWMGIWNRTDDSEMQKLEHEYGHLILNNIEKLRSYWLSLCGNFRHSRHSWVMQDAHKREDIEKAKERISGSPLHKYVSVASPEQASTDMRLMAVDYGMNDDILSVVKALQLMEELLESNPGNAHVRIEYGIMLGNASLDFSKFRMGNALSWLTSEYRRILVPGISELDIGYAFMIRNSSIYWAEIGESNIMRTLLNELESFSVGRDVQVQGELARTYANAIASLGSSRPEAIELFSRLKALFEAYPTDEKIKVAYRVSDTNMKKSHSV